MANKLTASDINDLRKAIEVGLARDYDVALSVPERLTLVEMRLRTLLEHSDLTKKPFPGDLTTRL